jgi:hypothetical protein
MRRLYLALLIPGLALLGLEEARFGFGLGRSRSLCEAIGGKFAPTEGRCVTRACAWFDDCGTWLSPARWRDRLKIGDPVSEVVFWLGRPERIDGDTYYWSGGKPERTTFAATIRDGRLAALDRD